MADQHNDHMKLPSGTTRLTRASMPQESDVIQDRGVILATRNHELIREWARRHSAEPATGEQTASGQATVDVHDGGARIRFNFPAAAAFRPISWEEWLECFERDHLVFVFEPDESAGRAGAFGRRASSYYRLLPAAEWSGDIR
jgi:hypothetical protein